MNSKFAAIVVLASTLATGSSVTNAADKMIFGVGNFSCTQWSKVRKAGDWTTTSQWVLGFLSATESYGTQLKKTNADEVLGWIDAYCTQNSSNSIFEATSALVTAFADKG